MSAFLRKHHQDIATLLGALDGALLERNACFFGGGTAVSLMHDEFRESVDVDLLCSSIDGYREARLRLTTAGVETLFLGASLPSAVSLAREVRADHYGVRCAFKVNDAVIKFEILFEGRIRFDAPTESICGVKTLNRDDLVASKLMANDDRYADDSVLSRDVLDLVVLAQSAGGISRLGWSKANEAYGTSIERNLRRAAERLLTRHGRLQACLDGLQVTLPRDGFESALKQFAQTDLQELLAKEQPAGDSATPRETSP